MAPTSIMMESNHEEEAIAGVGAVSAAAVAAAVAAASAATREIYSY